MYLPLEKKESIQNFDREMIQRRDDLETAGGMCDKAYYKYTSNCETAVRKGGRWKLSRYVVKPGG